ncbi:helix-turn-helix domain-containing protein [Fundicoccus sp. Sow4_H7]|uniref:helix-turn-helix domain-containing protein n=1 Tax=Fundicoccus sp. Sow4_H7 TaxID=3438784 RepID=UPI003F8DF736
MLKILDGGINTRHKENFRMKRANGIDGYLLLFIKTEAILFLNHQSHRVAPHSVILIDRHTPYEYYNPNGEYIDDWLFFDTKDKNPLQTMSPILNKLFNCQSIAQHEVYLQQLLWEKEYASPTIKDENMHLLFKVLLNNLRDSYDERHNLIYNNHYYRLFQELRFDIQSDPSITMTADSLASSLGISVSHFHHLYKDFFQSTYLADIIYFRTELAKTLLTTTELSIQQVMEACGYKNAVHFYRQFKERVHMTPANFRALHIQKTIHPPAK